MPANPLGVKSKKGKTVTVKATSKAVNPWASTSAEDTTSFLEWWRRWYSQPAEEARRAAGVTQPWTPSWSGRVAGGRGAGVNISAAPGYGQYVAATGATLGTPTTTQTEQQAQAAQQAATPGGGQYYGAMRDFIQGLGQTGAYRGWYDPMSGRYVGQQPGGSPSGVAAYYSPTYGGAQYNVRGPRVSGASAQRGWGRAQVVTQDIVNEKYGGDWANVYAALAKNQAEALRRQALRRQPRTMGGRNQAWYDERRRNAQWQQRQIAQAIQAQQAPQGTGVAPTFRMGLASLKI